MEKIGVKETHLFVSYFISLELVRAFDLFLFVLSVLNSIVISDITVDIAFLNPTHYDIVNSIAFIIFWHKLTI